ncbi:hypothetical protein [Singulisphaera acidiphila]|uniref:Uncharacterized protein n=1 Tax=Singulisphaera acidiphila (strain ATCC BAA-1392 / DSM 18658 / VKM B-2454 / MOB10) TaxID=886293 RepID=L0D9R2_SINAD|nr:hypothetical protein [Singulisphaera acidiphila]AGA25610.1 hypothetical protein Sinac_1221 [Singulisphaera acidiphila DSM 18658]
MKTHLSIYGLSATGKKTLIRRLLHPSGGFFRERFGVGEGAEAFGPFFGKETNDSNSVLKAIERSKAPIILNQWQVFLDPVVASLLADHPDWRHRAIVIYRPPHTLAVDLGLFRPTMYVDDPPTPESLAAIWHKQVESNLARHERSGLFVEVVDGSCDSYPPLPRDVLRTGQPYRRP